MKRVLVRSSSHFYLLAVLEQGGFLKDVGLSPTFEECAMADDADAMLLSGEVDMISGCHHTPYLHYDDGLPFVYLASSTNAVQEHLLTRESISTLSDISGQKVALRPLAKPGVRPDMRGEGHPRANRQIMLEQAGIAQTVQFVGYGPDDALSNNRFQSVTDGFADAAFISDPELSYHGNFGLHVLELKPLPMISGVTCTTTLDKVKEHEADQSFERFVLALHRATKFFKENREESIAIMERSADELKLQDHDEVVRRYERTANELDPTLTPTAAAIRNAFRIAEFERAGIAERVNPLALWDLHYVRTAIPV